MLCLGPCDSCGVCGLLAYKQLFGCGQGIWYKSRCAVDACERARMKGVCSCPSICELSSLAVAPYT
jgi:hypothetical protein